MSIKSNELDNIEKSRLSFRHARAIQSVFNNHIKGQFEIDHFSLNVFFGDESLFLSPTPLMAEKLCQHNFVNEDSNYLPSVYKSLSVYPWRAVQQHPTDFIINFIKEKKFGMKSGMMFVRSLGGDKYLMYSVATHRNDDPNYIGQMEFLFYAKAKAIFAMGDFMYDVLRPIINNYTEPLGTTFYSIDFNYLPNIKDYNFTSRQKELFEVIQGGSIENYNRQLKKLKEASLRLFHGSVIQESDLPD